MVETPTAGGITQPGRALSERARLDHQINVLMEAALERFLGEVQAQAYREVNTGGLFVITAAAGEPDEVAVWRALGLEPPARPSTSVSGPMRVTVGSVSEAWRWAVTGVIAALLTARGAWDKPRVAAATTSRVLDTGIPPDVYASVTAVLAAGANQGWSESKVRGEVAKALEPHASATGSGLEFTAVLDTEGTAWDSRASTVATTEAARSYNGAALDRIAGLDEEGMSKRWVAHHDERTRNTHRDADGQTVAVDDQFLVGGDMLDYPADPLGSAKETINCRCGLVAVPLDEEGKVPLPPTKSGMYQGAFGGYNAP